jgi:hypothetical protein
LGNTFEITDLVEYAVKAAGILTRWPSRSAVQHLLPLHSGRARIPDNKVRAAARDLVLEMADFQEKGRRYWKPVIAELKRLQRNDRLIPEGTSVASITEAQPRRH